MMSEEWHSLIQIQSEEKVMIQVGLLSKDPDGLQIVGISGREGMDGCTRSGMGDRYKV